MVKLRLKRMGSKFNAFYRIVVADARAPRDGKFIEEIGTYNPHSKEVKLSEELRDKWIKQGAVPSNTVKNLFTKVEAAKKAGNEKDGVVTLIKKVKKAKNQEVIVDEKVVDNQKKETESNVEEVKEQPKDKETK